MNTSNNTILITGGTAGIGYEFAKLLSKNNRVIITGRDKDRLAKALSTLKNTTGITSDVSNAEDVDKLVENIYREHPGLNIVINNAGKAYAYDLTTDAAFSFEKAGEEMLTNYLSIIRLNEKLLPLLRRQPAAAIVNVSSIVAFAPGVRISTYSASKAALHSYTLSLRHLLKTTNVKVFEVMPPLVDTALSADIDGHLGIKPDVVAHELLQGLEADRTEIRVAGTEEFYRYFLSSPEEAMTALNNR
ncbi:MAG TPA: SDR family NAD(P)-dependent oxidoreductase [Puia sp.]|nr:SDR family NAD(P)-dependent oxidoreductase [Puia sp.]